MRRIIYIHIGAHKTATTAIQRACWKNRRLMAECDVLYPESNIYHFGHHRLAFALKKQRDPSKGDIPTLDDEVRSLREALEKSEQSRVLLSSEAFFVTPENALTRLRDSLMPFEVHIIAFVRRQDDYLLSSYNQNARMVGNAFTKPLRAHVADPRGISREISFLKWLKKWQEAFGTDSVQLKRYEDRDPLASVLEAVGLPADLFTATARTNASASGAVTEAIRIAKRMGLPRSAQVVVRSAAKRAFSKWPVRTLSQAERALILEEFAEENERMFAAFGMENTYQPFDRKR